MLLLANHWYTRKSIYGDIHTFCGTEDTEASAVGWTEIEPPTILEKKKDLSHAEVGDKVERARGSFSWKVIHKGQDYALLLEDSGNDVFARPQYHKIPDGDFHLYTLITPLKDPT